MREADGQRVQTQSDQGTRNGKKKAKTKPLMFLLINLARQNPQVVTKPHSLKVNPRVPEERHKTTNNRITVAEMVMAMMMETAAAATATTTMAAAAIITLTTTIRRTPVEARRETSNLQHARSAAAS